jgi:hypothetical protein
MTVMYVLCERESFLFVLMLLQKLVLKALFVFVCAFTSILWCSTCNLFFEFAQSLVNSKSRNLSFYYAECKDTWDVPRDPASDLCSASRVHFPIITRGLTAILFLFYFPNALLYTCCLYCRGPLLLCCSFLWVR